MGKIQQEKPQKTPKKYICECCDFECSNKKDYTRHISTRKHKIQQNTTNIQHEKTPDAYSCECGKSYNHRASLYNHKKKCFFENFEKNAKKSEKNAKKK